VGHSESDVITPVHPEQNQVESPAPENPADTTALPPA
jgi:hypothetical protein